MMGNAHSTRVDVEHCRAPDYSAPTDRHSETDRYYDGDGVMLGRVLIYATFSVAALIVVWLGAN